MSAGISLTNRELSGSYYLCACSSLSYAPLTELNVCSAVAYIADNLKYSVCFWSVACVAPVLSRKNFSRSADAFVFNFSTLFKLLSSTPNLGPGVGCSHSACVCSSSSVSG